VSKIDLVLIAMIFDVLRGSGLASLIPSKTFKFTTWNVHISWKLSKSMSILVKVILAIRISNVLFDCWTKLGCSCSPWPLVLSISERSPSCTPPPVTVDSWPTFPRLSRESEVVASSSVPQLEALPLEGGSWRLSSSDDVSSRSSRAFMLVPASLTVKRASKLGLFGEDRNPAFFWANFYFFTALPFCTVRYLVHQKVWFLWESMIKYRKIWIKIF